MLLFLKKEAFEISLAGIKDVIHYNLVIMYLQFFLLQITSSSLETRKFWDEVFTNTFLF